MTFISQLRSPLIDTGHLCLPCSRLLKRGRNIVIKIPRLKPFKRCFIMCTGRENLKIYITQKRNANKIISNVQILTNIHFQNIKSKQLNFYFNSLINYFSVKRDSLTSCSKQKSAFQEAKINKAKRCQFSEQLREKLLYLLRFKIDLTLKVV